MIIGDPGFITHAYMPEIPLLKIVDRFYLEIATAAESPYTLGEKEIIRKNVENVINRTRTRFGISIDFAYHESVQYPALINGASYFVKDLETTCKFIGNHMALKLVKTQQPDIRYCFVSLGTGFAEHTLDTASRLLKQIEVRFKKIYVGYGTRIKKEHLYRPRNAIMEPVFNEVPDNVGAIICHGGYGISHLAVQLGIPVIVIPFQIEQYSNAYRLEKLGVGINAGTYDRSNFKGLYEKVQIDWDRFNFAVDNLPRIRTIGKITDRFELGGNLLFKYAEEFIKSL